MSASQAEHEGSIPFTCSKTKGTTKVVPFVLGSAAQRAAPPFGISVLGVGKAAPAQFSAASGGSEFTAQKRRRPEGRFFFLWYLHLFYQHRKNERHDKSRAFRFGFRRLNGGSTLRHFEYPGRQDALSIPAPCPLLTAEAPGLPCGGQTPGCGPPPAGGDSSAAGAQGPGPGTARTSAHTWAPA